MGDERLRLFLALWPDVAVRRALQAATRTAVETSGGRAVPTANYHLTLAFLGLQPRSQLDVIHDAISRLESITGTLHLQQIGYFRAARVLWAGPQRTPTMLSRQANRLRAALGANGVSFTPGPFRAHVTLARRVAQVPSVEFEPIHWAYTGVTLIESDRARPRYRVLAQWPGRDLPPME
ncbi:MAG: RNA 2',3'-cyclic phosphodiesterase [Gammaproteobacteria bacterium]